MTETATRHINAQAEAAEILRDIIERLSQQNRDIIIVLRKCIHVCNLLKLDTEKLWFEAELHGYRPDQVLAWYRHVQAQRYWRPLGAYDLVQTTVEQVLEGTKDASNEPYELRTSAGELTQYADKGLYFPTGKEELRWSSHQRRDITGQEVLGISGTTISAVLRHLEDDVFGWGSSAYSVVAFGQAASDIFASYRGLVDAKLTQIGLTSILDQISSGLGANQAQAWREAMYSCRDLLHDLAKYLWRDPRATYANLLDDDEKPIAVTDEKYINRLIAYLHAKGVVGTPGEYFRAEWRRLAKLNAFASRAHDAEAVTLEHARSVAIAVYIAVGEIVNRTDMRPVVNYVEEVTLHG